MSTKGFTLIELLIVVAIIAILAAIAVPNFLEAQTRSKTSRARNDLRAIAVSVESYVVDEGGLPPDANDIDRGPGPWPASVTEETGAALDLKTSGPEFWTFRTYRAWRWFTTPVAYMTSVYIDPFSRVVPLSYQSFAYSASYGPQTKRAFCMLSSCGPDKFVDQAGMVFRTYYDSTNGTTSAGDIFRPAAMADIGFAKSYYGSRFDGQPN
jgi:prepilin-type N-terminal cleavage/methylation domain-containing protein